MATVIIPADAELYMARRLAAIIAAVPELDGYTRGTTLKAGVTPHKFIRYGVVTSGDVDRYGDLVGFRVQVWHNDTATRRRHARLILGHLLSTAGRKTSGPIDMPDPADPSKSLSQFTVTHLLIGTQP